MLALLINKPSRSLIYSCTVTITEQSRFAQSRRIWSWASFLLRALPTPRDAVNPMTCGKLFAWVRAPRTGHFAPRYASIISLYGWPFPVWWHSSNISKEKSVILTRLDFKASTKICAVRTITSCSWLTSSSVLSWALAPDMSVMS